MTHLTPRQSLLAEMIARANEIEQAVLDCFGNADVVEFAVPLNVLFPLLLAAAGQPLSLRQRRLVSEFLASIVHAFDIGPQNTDGLLRILGLPLSFPIESSKG